MEREGEGKGGEGRSSAAVFHLEGFASLPAVVRHIQVLGVLGLNFK